jgi:hypothetical protein
MLRSPWPCVLWQVGQHPQQKLYTAYLLLLFEALRPSIMSQQRPAGNMMHLLALNGTYFPASATCTAGVLAPVQMSECDARLISALRNDRTEW